MQHVETLSLASCVIAKSDSRTAWHETKPRIAWPAGPLPAKVTMIPMEQTVTPAPAAVAMVPTADFEILA